MQMAHKLAYVEVQGKREMHLLMAVVQNYTLMQEAHQNLQSDPSHHWGEATRWPTILQLTLHFHYGVHDSVSFKSSFQFSELCQGIVCTSVCHGAMEEVRLKGDLSDLTLVHTTFRD